MLCCDLRNLCNIYCFGLYAYILRRYIMDGIYRIGVHNVAWCIIIFTVIVNILLLPLTIKQQKFMKLNSIMQPELMAIQKKYKDKKDQASVQKAQLEQQAVYDKYGATPTGG